MRSGCLLMLAPGGVDTSSRLSLSLPAPAESVRVRGRRRRSRTAEISPRPASQPEIQSTQIADGAIISALAKPGA